MSNIYSSDTFLENFDKDRNVILKLAQRQLCPQLVKAMVKLALKKYSELHNPLGLVDDVYQKILDYQFINLETLTEVYENLSVVYRFEHGDNQLEIVWDGRSQIKKYEDDWIEVFNEWAGKLCSNPSFVRSIIQLTALHEENTNTYFIQNHLKGIVNDLFQFKVLKRNGIKRVMVKTKAA